MSDGKIHIITKDRNYFTFTKNVLQAQNINFKTFNYLTECTLKVVVKIIPTIIFASEFKSELNLLVFKA